MGEIRQRPEGHGGLHGLTASGLPHQTSYTKPFNSPIILHLHMNTPDYAYNRIHVTWDDVERFVTQVSHTFEGRVNGVYGIPRGGLILAVMLSHRMDVPMLQAPCEGCLVVDEILDSGDTLKHYIQKGYSTAVMHRNPSCALQPTYHHQDTDGRWVVYPWECDDDSDCTDAI